MGERVAWITPSGLLPRRVARGLGIAACGLVFVYGAQLSFYENQLLAIALIFAITAMSLDFAWGFTGILSLGQAVFFGIGNYAVALVSVRVTPTGAVVPLETGWWTFPLGMALGIIAAMGAAFIVGVIAFRGKASTPFFVGVVTFALTVIASTAAIQSQALGGVGGLQGYAIHLDPVTWYWIIVAVFVAVGLVLWAIVRSDAGVLLRAIRDNEERCRYLGFNVVRVKTNVLVASAAVAALAGALYGGYLGAVSPPLLGFLLATEMLIWVAVGGRGTLLGPALGAILIGLVGPRLSATFPYAWTLFLGLLFILVVAFIPDGILPSIQKAIRWVVRHGPLGGEDADPVGSRSPTGRRLVVDTGREPITEGDPDGPPILTITDVYRSYGALSVLKGLSLDVRRGELLAVVGPNGAGKTTLLAAMTDGTVQYQGSMSLQSRGRSTALQGLAPRDIVRAGIGRKFQTPNLFASLSPMESVLLASRKGALPNMWARSREIPVSAEVLAIFAATSLFDAADVPARDLSHGQKQALELAMAVALEPEILLLDEPTAGLTAEERHMIGELLTRIVRDGSITVVLIEHDFDFIRQIADRIAVLHDGRALLVGTVAEVADSATVRNIYLGVTA